MQDETESASGCAFLFILCMVYFRVQQAGVRNPNPVLERVLKFISAWSEKVVMEMGNLSKENKNKELRFPMMENAEYQKAQNQEIKLGKEQGLDVSVYTNPEFNWLQMEQIRMGLKDNVDASIYANPAYSYDTMKQIRLSLPP